MHVVLGLSILQQGSLQLAVEAEADLVAATGLQAVEQVARVEGDRAFAPGRSNGTFGAGVVLAELRGHGVDAEYLRALVDLDRDAAGALAGEQAGYLGDVNEVGALEQGGSGEGL